MAYRQLYAVTFAVLGLAAVGCGGDTNANVSSGPDAAQQPPSNPDQPPSNSDQASSSDKTPSNPDQPVSNTSDPAGTGGGGRLGSLCQDLCSSLNTLSDQCGDGMSSMGDAKSLCSSDCVVPPNILPCESEIADVFSCLLDNLQLFCASVDSQDPPAGDPPAGDPQPAATPCQDVAKAYSKCAEVNHITDDNGDNNGSNGCIAPGCDCPSDCTKCTCKAGTDTEKRAACVDTCAP